MTPCEFVQNTNIPLGTSLNGIIIQKTDVVTTISMGL